MQLPKQVPKTIESMRVYDETMVAPGDDEVNRCCCLVWLFLFSFPYIALLWYRVSVISDNKTIVNENKIFC